MSTSDELKALGNKAIAAGNWDEAVYVPILSTHPKSNQAPRSLEAT
jgi:hypothetical protein